MPVPILLTLIYSCEMLLTDCYFDDRIRCQFDYTDAAKAME